VSGSDAYLADNRKNPGLALFCAVGTNSEIDLLGKSIGLVISCQGKDGVGRSSLDIFKDGS